MTQNIKNKTNHERKITLDDIRGLKIAGFIEESDLLRKKYVEDLKKDREIMREEYERSGRLTRGLRWRCRKLLRDKCRRCNENVVIGKVMCEKHLKADKETKRIKYRNRIDDGKCVYCGKKINGMAKKYCVVCLKKFREKGIERRNLSDILL